jgi:hypothetical protein
MFNVLVFLLLFFNSGDALAQGDVAVPYVAAPGNADSDRHHDETVGNGTAASDVHEGSTANEPVSEEQASPAAVDERVYQFDPVRVEAEKQQAGKTTIEGQELHSLPSHTGSITEAIKGFSNVQFSNDEISSLTGGEIRPPRVTISGAKPYENNFLIDGMSVSNTLNPSGLDQNGDSVSWNNLVVHGADQTIFYDSSLVDSVTVYSSNVPVKYGNFLGGLVAAELVDPRTDRWHGIMRARHTRSEWFDLRGVDEESETSDNQARFRANSLFASVDGPVGEKLALLFAVTRNWSVIPLQFKENDGTFSDKDQRRSNENFFAKVLFTPSSTLQLALDATYAPYSEERWKSGWDNSDWSIENNAYRLGSKLEWSSDAGVLTLRGAYSQNGFNRDSATNVWLSNSITNEKAGGVGDATTDTRELDAKLDFEVAQFATRDILWRISSGMDIKSVTTDMWNQAAYTDGTTASFLVKTDYLEHDQTRTLNTVGWYVQPEFQWGRFTFTPGLRIDYDDFSFNTNTSPRLKVEFDTMGDGALRLVGGVSRYYGGQLRAYAFDRYRPFITNRINRSTGQSMPTLYGVDRSYLAKDLDTPYSDETMGAILGEVMGFEYGIELVHRDHRDQLISKSMGDNLYEMTNDGKSTYDGLTLSLARSFETGRLGSHSFNLGMTTSRTKTFDGAYDRDVRLDLFSNNIPYDFDRVYYDGEIIDRSGMPADNYNAPVVVTFSWQGSFYDDHFRVNSVSRWRDSTTGLVKDARLTAETPYGTTSGSSTSPSSQWLSPGQQEYYDAYKKGVISGGLATDVSLELDAVKKDLFTFTFLFDVTNVFSSDGHSGVVQEGVPRDRMRGRGYYAGIRCEF